eukprot:11416379-Ditylum_brightwellii.AAC.1
MERSKCNKHVVCNKENDVDDVDDGGVDYGDDESVEDGDDTFSGLQKTKTGIGYVTRRILTKFSGFLELHWEFLQALL